MQIETRLQKLEKMVLKKDLPVVMVGRENADIVELFGLDKTCRVEWCEG